MGRQVRQLDYNAAGQVAWDHQQFYSAAGRVDRDHSVRLEAGATLTADTYNDYGWNGVVAGGQVVSATTYSYRNGQHQGTTSYQNGFSWRNGGAQIASTQTWGQTSSYTSYGYGVGGRLETISISDGRPRTVYVTADLSGQALTRDEYDNNGSLGDPHERWYRFNGNELGHVGNDGTWMSDYAGSVQTRGWVQANGPFGNNRRYGQDFAKSVDRITSYEQGSGAGGGYTVRAGDTLAGIAAQVWGDAGLWYKLAAANGLSANSALVPGSTLTLPAGVIRSTYNADQLRPYDPADAIGDVSPVSAQPTAKAKKNKCGAFGKILLVAVAVAVSVALPGGGTVIGAAVNGMIGSAVRQAVGLATGIQDKFSWKGVALAGIGAGIGAAVGGGTLIGGIGDKTVSAAVNGAVRGVIGNVATQGIAIATGLQAKFDFAGVAAAGLSGGVGGAIGHGLKLTSLEQSRSLGNIAGHALNGTARAIAGATARSLIDGTSFGDNVLAALPDAIGQTIGDLIGSGITDARARGAINRALRAPTTADEARVADRQLAADPVASLQWGGEGLTPEQARTVLISRMRYERLAETWVGKTTSFNARYADFRAALAASDAYNPTSNQALLGTGLVRVTKGSLVRGVESGGPVGYRGFLYQDRIGGGYVFANAGTNDQADVQTNYGLGGNSLVDQVSIALENAERLVRNGVPNLRFSGHSLGGALAIAQGLHVGRSVVTFNSAPFTTNVARRHGVSLANAGRLVTNYQVANDPLSTAERNGTAIAIGTLIGRRLPLVGPLIPSDAPVRAWRLAPPPGRIMTLPAGGPVSGAHSIVTVIRQMTKFWHARLGDGGR